MKCTKIKYSGNNLKKQMILYNSSIFLNALSPRPPSKKRKTKNYPNFLETDMRKNILRYKI